jgi:hypothetical protein
MEMKLHLFQTLALQYDTLPYIMPHEDNWGAA